MKTKVSVKKMENICKCSFIHGIDIRANGSRGGLSSGWTQNEDVTLQSYSNHHFDVEIFYTDRNCKWRLTGFYGHLDERMLDSSCNFLRRLGYNQIL